jgi:hypothetical protein
MPFYWMTSFTLTSWSKVLTDLLKITQLAKKLPTFYRIHVQNKQPLDPILVRCIQLTTQTILGIFTKQMKKVTISLIMSITPSAQM